MEQETAQRACGRCGADNAPGAQYCWQCYTSFGGPAGTAQATPATAGPLATAIGRGPGAGTPSAVVSEAPTITRWQPQHGAAKDAAVRWVVRGLVVAVAAVGGYLAYQRLFGGFPFPDQVAGQPRLESDVVEEAEDLIASMVGAFNVEVEIAMYGPALPQYLVAALEVPDGQLTEQFYQGFVSGSGVTADAVDPNAVTCGAAPGGVTQCSWVQEDTVVLVQGLVNTGVDLQPVAEDVRADVA
jgi:hypothetical protein